MTKVNKEKIVLPFFNTFENHILKNLFAFFSHEFNNLFSTINMNFEHLSEKRFKNKREKNLIKERISSHIKKGILLSSTFSSLLVMSNDIEQSVNERILAISEIFEFLERKKSINFALSNYLPNIFTPNGTIEKFFLFQFILFSKIATKNSRILIESGTTKIDNLNLPFVSTRINNIRKKYEKILKNKTIFKENFLNLHPKTAILDYEISEKTLIFKIFFKNSLQKDFKERKESSMKNKSSNILIIEDEKALADVLRDMLEEEGYNVFLAYDLKNAKTIIDKLKNELELIISDVFLKDGNGFDFCKKIVKVKKFPVLVMSGFLENCEINEIKREGFSILYKPFKKSNFLEAVIATLEKEGENGKDSDSRR